MAGTRELKAIDSVAVLIDANTGNNTNVMETQVFNYGGSIMNISVQ